MKKEFVWLFIVLVLIVGVVAVLMRDRDVAPILPGTDIQPARRTVSLFYYNPEIDRDEVGNVMCSKAGLVPVTREIEQTGHYIEDTIKLLLLGELTPDERNSGISTEYPLVGLELTSSNLDPLGKLTLVFKDAENKTSGGACRVSVLRAQVVATAEQFTEVGEVEVLPVELFQP